MNVCTPCTSTKTVPECVTDLTIGTIAALSTAVYVYIKNITLNKIVRYSATSNGAGLVIVDISDTEFMPTHSYELWVTLATAANIDDKEDITINAVVYTCFELHFDYILGSNNTTITYLAQTLEIA